MAVRKEAGEDHMDQQKEGKPVRRRARGLQRMVSILDAAEVVFAKAGYDEATTHQIADQAGISPGSLYQFFSNKEEIAQALAARYIEELQRVYSTVFSVEAAALPFSQWLDQIVDALIAFHLAHPAFHTLFDAPPSLEVAGLTHRLPKELQTHFELGFQVRAPHLSAAQRRLSATISVQLFRAVPRLVLQAEEAEQRLLVRELKTALQRYLEPYLG
jgi:AcrR family transcriptional regulator